MISTLSVDPRLATVPQKHLRPVVIRVQDFDEADVLAFTKQVSRALETGQPVLPIVVDSYGGEAYGVLGMLSVLDQCPLPVITLCESKAMSAGALLFALGEERYVAPTATLMIHDIATHHDGKLEDIKADAEETGRLQEILYRRIAQTCGKPATYFLDLIDAAKHADRYFSAQDAKKHGLATHIGLPSFHTVASVTHTLRLDGSHRKARR